MLRISKLADYATVIMHCLMADESQVLSANQVAQRVSLSAHTVSKILKILLEAGLVASVRGAGGGYRLAKPAQAITVAAVITAIEGEVAFTECSQSAQICRHESTCTIKHNWQTINRFLIDTLESVSLADMAQPLALMRKNANAARTSLFR